MNFKDLAKTNGAHLGAVDGMIHLDCRLDFAEGQSKLASRVVDDSELGILGDGFFLAALVRKGFGVCQQKGFFVGLKPSSE